MTKTGSFNRNGFIPREAFTGTEGLVTQSFIEANAKNGTGFEASALFQGLAALASNNTIVLTGSKPVILKSRIIKHTGSIIVARIFEDATYTGGSAPGPAASQTRLPGQVGVSETTFVGGATINTDGVECFAPSYSFGAGGGAGNRGQTPLIPGAERILKPNTTYLFRITNLDTANPCDVTSEVLFYEGPLSGDIA